MATNVISVLDVDADCLGNKKGGSCRHYVRLLIRQRKSDVIVEQRMSVAELKRVLTANGEFDGHHRDIVEKNTPSECIYVFFSKIHDKKQHLRPCRQFPLKPPGVKN